MWYEQESNNLITYGLLRMVFVGKSFFKLSVLTHQCKYQLERVHALNMCLFRNSYTIHFTEVILSLSFIVSAPLFCRPKPVHILGWSSALSNCVSDISLCYIHVHSNVIMHHNQAVPTSVQHMCESYSEIVQICIMPV